MSVFFSGKSKVSGIVRVGDSRAEPDEYYDRVIVTVYRDNLSFNWSDYIEAEHVGLGAVHVPFSEDSIPWSLDGNFIVGDATVRDGYQAGSDQYTIMIELIGAPIPTFYQFDIEVMNNLSVGPFIPVLDDGEYVRDEDGWLVYSFYPFDDNEDFRIYVSYSNVSESTYHLVPYSAWAGDMDIEIENVSWPVRFGTLDLENHIYAAPITPYDRDADYTDVEGTYDVVCTYGGVAYRYTIIASETNAMVY